MFEGNNIGLKGRSIKGWS